jgi:hypothetical protein
MRKKRNPAWSEARARLVAIGKYLCAAVVGAAVALVFVLLAPVEVHLDARCASILELPRGMMQ